MSATPLWVPLVVAGIGVAGTLTAGIAGALVAQRWANQRDDKTWAREREREQERWRREDEARTFEHRREAFEDFYRAVKALARRAYDHGYGFDQTPELPFDWNADAFAKLQRLGIYVDRISYVLQSPFHVEWLCVACFVIAGSAIDVTVRDGGWRLLRPGQGLAGV